jgi:hypothetical protein
MRPARTAGGRSGTRDKPTIVVRSLFGTLRLSDFTHTTEITRS